MTIARTLLAATAALFIGAGAAQAAAIHSPEGKWVTNGGESKYEISLCGKRGDSICAKLIWADDSPLGQKLKANIVKTDILEVPRTGNQRWYGKLEWQGHVVRGTIDLTDANNIHIKGCNGAVCQTVELIRIK